MQRAAWPTVLALLSAGCPSAKTPPQAPAAAACQPTKPVVAITASDRINSSSAGQARPVQVRIYQLKSDARLATAKFEEIWQNDAAVLDKDLVKVDEYTVYPGQSKSVSVERSPEAQTLAAVALFREPQTKGWFLTYELEAPRKQPPCAPSESRIPIWIDRMQIEDGQGRTESPTTGVSKGN
jgi:type VI secretion system protein VasD